ncbi:DUF1000-domain-containing protein [Tilletiaria anomala UBC 951]|uniref:DUF1000-domain-containing protein n=1 Tax=Tilletiaria anomala (strain ATCC 24038 / CBS 436.72 / UBC 951) TaxID=1037660 RepID=A0A066WE91_TILAU|nr:DUF1000-domain-containing protein [Tilletiaria anomala UBC 951]KDN52096.1 DUF1000-domain-containing protein [Tilletiaria anomala UBC 951]
MNCNDEVTTVDVAARRPGGSNGDHSGGGSGSEDDLNLYTFIDRDQVHGLNLADPPEQTAKAPIKPWDRRDDTSAYAESGVDDTFILTVPFTCAVRLKSVLLNPGIGDFAPRRVRAYVNRPDGVDFDDVTISYSFSSSSLSTRAAGPAAGPAALPAPSIETGMAGVFVAPMARAPASAVGNVGSGKPQADFALLEGTPGVVEYPLPIARFANTNSVSIVFSHSQAGDLSRLYYLGFRGTALQLKQEPGEKLDIGAANAADAPVNSVRERYGAAQNTNVR